MTLTDGTELTPALGIGAFVDKTLVHEAAVHQGRSRGRSRGGRVAGLRRDGRASARRSTPARSPATTPSR